MCSWHAWRGRVHEDRCMATVEFVEDRIQGFVAKVCTMGVGEEDHAVAVEVIEGVSDLE